VPNLFELYEFEWDEGNKYKSVVKHGVTNEEAEDALLDPDGKIRKTKEGRYIHLGVTSSGKHLFQIFVFKMRHKIRIISSRSMGAVEKRIYKTK
jgi:uncharacterized DUF497 family protein